MTLLINVEIGGVEHFVSNEPVALPQQYYKPLVTKISSLKLGTPKKYGGYARLVYSNFSLSPNIFTEDNWPPPDEISMSARYVDDDGRNPIELFEATGVRSNITRTDIEYRLYGNDYSEVVNDEVFSGSLVSIFEEYAGPAHLGVRFNSILARSPSPDVQHTASGEILDILSDIASFFSHMFYMVGDTLHLIDLKQDALSYETGEGKFLSGVRYRDNIPYQLFKAGEFSIDGSSSFGAEFSISPVCHDTQSNIETAIADIKSIMESQLVEVTFPLDTGNIRSLGSNLTWSDESMQFSTDVSIGIRSLIYNFDKDEFTVSGEGVVSLSS